MCPGKSQREGGCLGFRITANHHGINMFTGCGGISSVRMIFFLRYYFCPVSSIPILRVSWKQKRLLYFCPYVQYIYCDEFLNIWVKLPHGGTSKVSVHKGLVNISL